jgi:hypothetical protein
LSFGIGRTLGSSAGRQESDQQCWPKKIADVLDGIARSEIAGLDDVHDMDDGRPHAEDSHRDDGGLTEAVAAVHGDNAEDAYSQVGKADLELEGIAGRPTDGHRDRVGNEDVTEEPTYSASGHTDPEQIQQEDFQPALAGPTTPVQTKMAGSDDDQQDGEDEDADRNTVHTFSIP